MELSTMLSEKGKLLLLAENFKFRKYRECKQSGEVCWCCTVKTCNSKLFTIGPDNIFSRKVNEHNNESLPDQILNRHKVSNSVKRKAESDTSERPRKLIHKEIAIQKNALDTLTVKDVKCISKNINYSRLKLIPKLPSSAVEVHNYLDSVQIKTIQGENFLLHNSSSCNIVIFSCTTNVKVLCEQEIILVDGTFDYCTKHFLQKFTIHSYVNNMYVPLAYCLLMNKKEETYKKLFSILKSECTKLGYEFEPTYMVVDFEKAIHTAATEAFPQVIIIGCRFHLSQAWLALIVVVYVKYYHFTWDCSHGGIYVRAYILGMMALLSLVILVLIALVNRSAKGAITDVHARRHVPPILLTKLFLIIPETVINVFGTMWAFCKDVVVCPEEHFVKTVIEALVVFNWVLFGLAIFGVALIYDPLGSKKYSDLQESPSTGESIKHRKSTSLWQRRFRWAFCWVRSDEHGHEAFQQVAALLSSLFRSTDLVPTDILAGCVLLRVKQKRETREMRRIYLLSDDEPKYSADINRVFSVAPRWMNLENAAHFLKLSMAAYGWPFVIYQYCMTGIFRLIRKVTCCACFRRRQTIVTDDNCCLCHLAGVRYISKLEEEHIIFASFRNHVFELPFCVIADHKTCNIVIAIRGSISLRDIFTDLTATSDKFEAEGLPPDTMAHKGMIIGANYVHKRLNEAGVLEKAFAKHKDYGLVLTGHSLGAGVATLLAFRMRSRYPDLKVYAFSTPAGLLSREAAKVSESFVFTVGVGDDFIMRLGVDSIENLRTGVIQVLQASKLPKYRILLNGFGYALFGVPPGDLESTWRDETTNIGGRSPLLGYQFIPTVAQSTEAALLSRNISVRRFSKTRLFTAGRILHIVSRKKTKTERKTGKGGPSFEMRWATAEDFMELKVMPRMLVDHLPHNVYKTIDTVLKEQKEAKNEVVTVVAPSPITEIS